MVVPDAGISSKLTYNGLTHLSVTHLARPAARGTQPMPANVPSPATASPRQRQADCTASASGAAWLPLTAARVVCAALALGAVALYATAVPARYVQLLTPCVAGRCAPGQVATVG